MKFFFTILFPIFIPVPVPPLREFVFILLFYKNVLLFLYVEHNYTFIGYLTLNFTHFNKHIGFIQNIDVARI